MKFQVTAVVLGFMALCLSLPSAADASREQRLTRRTLQDGSVTVIDPIDASKVGDSNDDVDDIDDDDEAINRAANDELKQAADDAAANRVPPGRRAPTCSKKSRRCKFGSELIPYPAQGGGMGQNPVAPGGDLIFNPCPNCVVVPIQERPIDGGIKFPVQGRPTRTPPASPLPPVCDDDQYPCTDSEYPDVTIDTCGSGMAPMMSMMRTRRGRRLDKKCVETKSEDDLLCQCQAHFIQDDDVLEVANQCVGPGGDNLAWIVPRQMRRSTSGTIDFKVDDYFTFLTMAEQASIDEKMKYADISAKYVNASEQLTSLSRESEGQAAQAYAVLSATSVGLSTQFQGIPRGGYVGWNNLTVPEELCTIMEWLYLVLGSKMGDGVELIDEEDFVRMEGYGAFQKAEGLKYTGTYLNRAPFANSRDMLTFMDANMFRPGGMIMELFMQCGRRPEMMMRGGRSTLYCCKDDCKDVEDCRYGGTRNSCEEDSSGRSFATRRCTADTCDSRYEMEVITSTVKLFDGCTESAVFCCPREADEVPGECPRGTIPNPCLDPSSLLCSDGPAENLEYPYFKPDYINPRIETNKIQDLFTCSKEPFAATMSPSCGPPSANSCVPDPCRGFDGPFAGGEVTWVPSMMAEFFEGRLYCGEQIMMICGMGTRGRMLSTGGIPTKPPTLPKTYEPNPILAKIAHKDLSFAALSEALRCDAIAHESRPIHDASKFRSLRKTYEDVVGPERSSITQLFLDQDKFEYTPIPAGETDHLRIEEIFGRGRGITTSKDIKKGDKLWSDVHLAEFHDIEDLRRFLAVVPEEIACDIVLWTYTLDEAEDSFYFSVDLDLSTFCNDGGYYGTNVEWIHGEHFDTATAARDIAAGEEILCNYKAI